MTQPLLQKWAERTPDAMFALFENGPSWTYQQALTQSWIVGAGLARLGVRPGEAVLSFLPNGVEAVSTMLGANACGAVYAPINTAYRLSFLQHAVNVPKAALIVVHASLVDQLAGLDVPDLKTIVVVGSSNYADPGRRVLSWDEMTAVDPVAPSAAQRRDPTDDMVYIYTSGTTGPSKAVCCSYVHHDTYAKWFGHGDIGAQDRAMICLPMFHIGGTGWLHTMLYRGGSFAMVERFSTQRFWSQVRSMNVTTGTVMAAMGTFLMREPERDDDADNPLRIALLVPDIPDSAGFSRRFDVKLWSGFGMTEVPGPTRTPLGSPNLKSAGLVTAPEWHLRLVNENDVDVPDDVPGELIVRHDIPGAITRGYLNMPEATEKAWRGGWFRTGDLFRRDANGDYYFVDRNKDALRRRGENISSVEVEAVIVEHPGVLQAAIVGVPSNEMEDEVMAFIVRQDPDLDAETLFEYLGAKLPHFMVPRYIEFIEALPRTPTEKVIKTGLREQGVSANTWDCVAAGYVVKASGITRKAPAKEQA